MPCRSEHMEPTAREKESKIVAQHIVFVHNILFGGLNTKTYGWILQASKEYYGKQDKVDELTKILCSLLKSLSEEHKDEIIYNGRNKQSRKLADWWEKHQEFDMKRLKALEQKHTNIKLINKTLNRLSKLERKALDAVVGSEFQTYLDNYKKED